MAAPHVAGTLSMAGLEAVQARDALQFFLRCGAGGASELSWSWRRLKLGLKLLDQAIT